MIKKTLDKNNRDIIESKLRKEFPKNSVAIPGIVEMAAKKTLFENAHKLKNIKKICESTLENINSAIYRSCKRYLLNNPNKYPGIISSDKIPNNGFTGKDDKQEAEHRIKSFVENRPKNDDIIKMVEEAYGVKGIHFSKLADSD